MKRTREILVKWEGCVYEELDEHTFSATLIPSDKDYDEMATLRYDNFPLRDRTWLVPGGIFYWWIWKWHGTEETGTTFKVRKAFWTKEALARAKEYAQRFSVFFDDNPTD